MRLRSKSGKLRTCLHGSADVNGWPFHLQVCSHSPIIFSDTLLDKQQAFKHLRDDHAKVQGAFERKMKELKTMKEKNEKAAPLYDRKGEPLPLLDELENLEYFNVEDIEAAIEEAEQKVNSIHHDPNAVRQYKENLAEVEKVEKQLEQVRGSKDAIDRRIQQLLAPWKRELETAIERVNQLFERYMAEVQCTGESF
jgi:chromosome segregation ATPase